jgi:hypothetical protein
VNEFIKTQWGRIVVLAAALFAVNLLGRLAARTVDGDEQQTIAGWITLGVLAAIFAVLAILWGRTRPIGPICFELGMAAVIGCLLSVLVGPLVFGLDPFANGAGDFFAQIFWYAGLAAVGTGLGLVIIIALGVDYRAKQLRRYAQYVERTSKTTARRS